MKNKLEARSSGKVLYQIGFFPKNFNSLFYFYSFESEISVENSILVSFKGPRFDFDFRY